MDDMISWMQEGGQVSYFMSDIVMHVANPFILNYSNWIVGWNIRCHKQYQETKEYADENG